MADPRRKLTVVDRTLIESRRRDGWGVRRIALALGRSPGTISAELKRHGGAASYQAETAEAAAAASRRLSHRQPRLAVDGALFAEIARLLGLGWSPEQIAGRRKRIEAGMEQPTGYLIHVAGYNLGLIMRLLTGAGTPRGFRTRASVPLLRPLRQLAACSLS